MTLCVDAMCEDRGAIVLAADRMVGQGFIQAELDIEKIVPVHPDWWVMFAGTVSHSFDIIDNFKSRVQASEHYGVAAVLSAFEQAYQVKRMAQVEAEILAPRGLTAAQFQTSGLAMLGEIEFRTLLASIASYQFDLSLIVAGFDHTGQAQTFTVASPGVATRQDIPGYCAIGNGMFGALYFMFYREVSMKMPAYETLYYVFEAQTFGFEAGGIGYETDFVVARFGEPAIRFQESKMPEIEKLWKKFRPRPTSGLEAALGKYTKQPERTDEADQETQEPEPEGQ